MSIQRITGTVQSGVGHGALPLGPAVTVAVYETADLAPRRLGSTVTDAEGRFSVEWAGHAAGAVLYAAAYVHTGVTLVAVLGPTPGARSPSPS